MENWIRKCGIEFDTVETRKGEKYVERNWIRKCGRVESVGYNFFVRWRRKQCWFLKLYEYVMVVVVFFLLSE